MTRSAFHREPGREFSKKNSKTSTVCPPAEAGSERERWQAEETQELIGHEKNFEFKLNKMETHWRVSSRR